MTPSRHNRDLYHHTMTPENPINTACLQLSLTLPNVPINLYQEQSFMGSPPLIEYDRMSEMFERIPRPNEYDLRVGTSIHTGQRVNTLN